MTSKPKSPGRPAPANGALKNRLPAHNNPLPRAETRWQRTVRYGWDNGGAKGGSNGGRR